MNQTKFRKIINLYIFVAISVIASLTKSYADKGKDLYALCIACHGEDGQGKKELNAPNISGLNDWYIEAQLKKFKAGIRGTDPKDTEGLQMRPMALTLTSDEDLLAVVKHVASLDAKKPEKTVEGDIVKGKTHYLTCTACHGDKAQGNQQLNAPSLKHLDDWYILSQLKKFKEGIRGTNPKDITGAQMRPMSMILVNEQAMKDVTAFIQTLNAE